MRPTWSTQANQRGQVVLLAALVLVVALVPMVLAYLQLGYDGDVYATVEEDTELGAQRVLDRAVHDAADGIPASYGWEERTEAAETVRERLEPARQTLEHSRLDEGIAYELTYNESRAAEWTDAHCPAGPDRQFGACETSDGIVVQDRTDRTHVLAVAVDIAVTTPEGTGEVTTVIRIRTG